MWSAQQFFAMTSFHKTLRLSIHFSSLEANFSFSSATTGTRRSSLKNHIRAIGRWSGEVPCQAGMRRYKPRKPHLTRDSRTWKSFPTTLFMPGRHVLSCLCSSQSRSCLSIPRLSKRCGTLTSGEETWGGAGAAPARQPCRQHRALYDSVSVVTPCFNEEMNVPALVDALVQMYGDYLHEIIIVNDNSTDPDGRSRAGNCNQRAASEGCGAQASRWRGKGVPRRLCGCHRALYPHYGQRFLADRPRTS